MHREAATTRKQSSLRTAAIVTICVLGCIAGLSLLALRQTAIQYHHLLEARKDFETTQNALRADLLKQIDETDTLKQQLDAAQSDRTGIRQQLIQLQQEHQSPQRRDGQLSRLNVPDRRQPSLELTGQSEESVARSFKAGVLPQTAPTASNKLAAATARTPALASPGIPEGSQAGAAVPASPQRVAQGRPSASQKELQAEMGAAQRYPNVANVAYGSTRSRSMV